jgi:hypothetical protein
MFIKSYRNKNLKFNETYVFIEFNAFLWEIESKRVSSLWIFTGISIRDDSGFASDESWVSDPLFPEKKLWIFKNLFLNECKVKSINTYFSSIISKGEDSHHHYHNQ